MCETGGWRREVEGEIPAKQTPQEQPVGKRKTERECFEKATLSE